MTPQAAKEEINVHYGVLINRGMLKVTVKGRVLTLSGKIKAVQSMDANVMFKFMPNHCKPMLKREIFKKDEATYSYKFERISDVYS